MDEQVTLLDWFFKGLSALALGVAAMFHKRLERVEDNHEELSKTIAKDYTRKDDFHRVVDNIDKTLELINKKLDTLFVPRGDK